ncbi:MAG: ROK family protein [Sphingobacteriales bacterium]|jgi:predicted NBD/HSP70 family sugar kinase|nr:ROK family protein [Sphingobacteriales bacterium]NCT73797.1 ROK family protein [Chitinophagaceae bacterium]OJW30989.1 MAG: sugar kinase [Sphingobacteriales bacterium 46-32]
MGKKGYYKGLVLREFYFSDTLSCADISERIGKSLPLTMKILNELIAEGYVRESGFAPSSGGRRPVMYSIVPDTIYILSVAMDQLVTRITLMDIHNEHVTEIERFELPLFNNPDVVKVLAEKMNEVIEKSGVARRKVIGAGIGMPGFIDFNKGINYSYAIPDGQTLTEYLSEKLDMPVYLDNDSSLIALAEFRFGAARHKRNAMVINIGWGIGLGMVINGELFRGHDGFAGEFSHMPMFNNNKLCECGKTGCLETEASLLVVVEKAAEGVKQGRLSNLGPQFPSGHFEQDCEAVIRAATMGDQFAIELLSEAGYNIGRGVAILIHLVNPELVILSGRGALAGRVWQAPIQQALNKHCIPRLAANTTVEISTLGYQAELIGSAALVMENMVKERKKQASRLPEKWSA